MTGIQKLAQCLAFSTVGFLLAGSPVNGDIIRDGSAGPDTSVQPLVDSNNSYQIGESMGALFGDNNGGLLHSFSEFSIQQGQQAVFTGNSSIQSIISRVTGASPSMIDGILKSEIANAHFFLLNPQGVLFGKNAEINMAGDFSVSTSQSLLFSNGESLQVYSADALPIIQSPIPEAFGFLNNNAGSILLDAAMLASAGKISLHAGDVSLQNREHDFQPR